MQSSTRPDPSATGSALRLEPEPASPGAARRWVRDAATGLGATSAAVESAVLLTSELVTNVVLHAHTPLEVEVGRAGPALRVVVRDGCPDLPHPSPGVGTSTTGRGLLLLERVATAWGTDPLDGAAGKGVWFTVPLDQAEPDDARPDDLEGWSELELDLHELEEPARADPRHELAVTLLAVPAQLWTEVRSHVEELVRELALVGVAESGGTGEPGWAGLVTSWEQLRGTYADALEEVAAALRRAHEQGRAQADLVLRLGDRTGAAVLAELAPVAAQVVQVEQQCREQALLLTPQLSAQAWEFARWLAGEVAAQLRGAAPLAWPARRG
ncbi:hypothetical protein EV189_0696 [Motilibacter rhizosphaerae]|uniref:Histidine kinase/HSP90-like ATPase domain-containing protein n=1 Tax=Motilibacter rhizosphaerae TaxID=598652 RepID=A0A4Q7NW74_9ACTN|nr:ATP-binding protein [Motilibacter rhizosphaerae]RZS91455.1 hypothetical protein EV189_0696 [Motilibacter rhizosphaerae]